MNIEIIAVGNEILTGFTVNSNAAFISRELLKAGIPTTYHTVGPDRESVTKKLFAEALQRNRIVISTGGLGPTCDDLTRKWAADLFDSPFVFNREVADDLIKRYGADLVSLQDQATVPEKAKIMTNTRGTAPGFIFDNGKATLFLLPGVPAEMEEMFLHSALPEILKIWNSKRKILRRFHFSFLTESKVDPELRVLQKKFPSLDFGIYPAKGALSVHISGEAGEEPLIEESIEYLRSFFSEYEYFSDSGTIEEGIHQLFIESGSTLSIAESCTGGSISARLASLPGASSYFLGSAVTYSDQMKKIFLGVSEEALKTEGAVSRKVVEMMVEGILRVTGSDYGLAVTGIAGPSGGTSEKPVGTVWIAVQKKGEPPEVRQLFTRGNRRMIIEYACNTVLGDLYRLCRKNFI